MPNIPEHNPFPENIRDLKEIGDQVKNKHINYKLYNNIYWQESDREIFFA